MKTLTINDLKKLTKEELLHIIFASNAEKSIDSGFRHNRITQSENSCFECNQIAKKLGI
jgi:hypothetical protein